MDIASLLKALMARQQGGGSQGSSSGRSFDNDRAAETPDPESSTGQHLNSGANPNGDPEGDGISDNRGYHAALAQAGPGASLAEILGQTDSYMSGGDYADPAMTHLHQLLAPFYKSAVDEAGAKSSMAQSMAAKASRDAAPPRVVEAGGESNPMFAQQERSNVLGERARSAKREDLSNQLIQSQLTRAHSQEGGYKNAEDRAQDGLRMLEKILKQRFGI